MVVMMIPHHTPSAPHPNSSSTLSLPLHSSAPPSLMLPKINLSDITPYDGSSGAEYLKAVETLAGSLMRHNAAVIQLGSEDAAIIRCGLEATRFYFRVRPQSQSLAAANGTSRGVYTYRAGSASGDWDSSPPCMAEIFRCMGKTARATLSAIAKHLRLRSDIFNHLLDDTPLPVNEMSSSILLATYNQTSMQNGKGAPGGRSVLNADVEKGLLSLISSDSPGLQVCDPNGRWFIADSSSGPGDLLLITGKALSHVTAGLRPAGSYRAALENVSDNDTGGRTSLTFKLMPQANAILDCSPIAAAGHVIPQSYVPVSVRQFMDDLLANEDIVCSQPDNPQVAQTNLNKEPSLRSVLSDPISGAFLEDAMVVSCGHSFGGLMLGKVLDMLRCTICNAQIEAGSLIPNYALRAAATTVKHEDDRRLFHNAALRKRRKELCEQTDSTKKPNRENGEMAADDVLSHVVQYPFAVNEKVLIEGNRRTPEKFVGKEAIITSQCLNGWYLLKIIGSGESVRLQYRSLRKILNFQTIENLCASQPIENSST